MIKSLFKIIFKISNRINFFLNKVNITSDFNIKGLLLIKNKGTIHIESEFKGNSGYIFNPIGGSSTLSFTTLENGNISVGRNVKISNSAIFCALSITIEDNVMIGGDCKIYDTNFHSLEYKERVLGDDSPIIAPVLIKEGAFIGAGSIILKGVTIGSRSIVGAGSVVTSNIPDGQIWGGNPCCYIRDI